MRRKDREITDHSEIEEIIRKSDVCRIAFADGNVPYIVALNFGYRPGNPPCLYFHCAPEGRKLELLSKNNLVCFQMDTDRELVRGEKACDWGMKYRSVVGMGGLTLLEDPDKRTEALNCIMGHYTGNSFHEFDPAEMKRTAVLKLEIAEISGKKKGY
jgi:uncharacterized protein